MLLSAWAMKCLGLQIVSDAMKISPLYLDWLKLKTDKREKDFQFWNVEKRSHRSLQSFQNPLLSAWAIECSEIVSDAMKISSSYLDWLQVLPSESNWRRRGEHLTMFDENYQTINISLLVTSCISTSEHLRECGFGAFQTWRLQYII
jgi:hypothetical protein